MQTPQDSIPSLAWARLRFAVIGTLLSSPPPRGQLAKAIRELSEKLWRHPTTGELVKFGASTIEAWYYEARKTPNDPVGALRRKIRKDAGGNSINPKLTEYLRAQYKKYPKWSYMLHVDNLTAFVEEKPAHGPVPSYSTIRRYMVAHGMLKRKGKGKGSKGHVEPTWEERESRSFEAAYVGSLWHLDFHHCSRKILAPNGRWYRPIALGIHDDRARLACHVQWYLSETTDDLVHGACQAFEKFQLPAAIFSDNGSAMKAQEFLEGLERLGVSIEKTLPRSPWQNGKEEAFWGPLEGRLMAMLIHQKDLTLEDLNAITQAWVDQDYNRRTHSELGMSPLRRYTDDPDVLRPCPSSQDLREAFRLQETRTQRQSDGTISIAGVRFEIPARFRHMKRLIVRYARWDLQLVHLVDERTNTLLCRIYPLDKEANADGRRRKIAPPKEDGGDALEKVDSPGNNLPPLLRKYVRQYLSTGRPPGYITKPFKGDAASEGNQDNEDHDDGMAVTV